MKSKTFRKKLTLNKKTIADLNMGKMNKVYGGILESYNQTACTCEITGGCCTYGCPTENSCRPTGEFNCICA
jgi:hypothetical protein